MPLRHFFAVCQGFATFVRERLPVPSGGGAVFWEREVRMDMLHLVPAALLCTLGCWLLWPVVIDPISRRRRAARVEKLGATDRLADALFEDWGDQSRLDASSGPSRG